MGQIADDEQIRRLATIFQKQLHLYTIHREDCGVFDNAPPSSCECNGLDFQRRLNEFLKELVDDSS